DNGAKPGLDGRHPPSVDLSPPEAGVDLGHMLLSLGNALFSPPDILVDDDAMPAQVVQRQDRGSSVSSTIAPWIPPAG
ncbi:hypothetical protein ACCS56_37870, partial [Rhizobium ruizarguesonis]